MDIQVLLEPRDQEVMQEQLGSQDPEDQKERKDQLVIQVTQENR